jgi:hypothetical protein
MGFPGRNNRGDSKGEQFVARSEEIHGRMIIFYPTLKETLWYLLGPSWVPAEKLGMTATPKESEDTFFLKPAIRQQASSGTRHCIGIAEEGSL